MNANKSETTRLALASAVLLGSRFRRQVIEKARDKYHATAPELGLDYGLLLRVCAFLEERETKFLISFVLLGLGVLLALRIENFDLTILFILFIVGLQYFKSFEERFHFSKFFQRDHFVPSRILKRFNVDLDPELERGVPESDQNVAIYQGFVPFVGAGTELGGWSFTVDVTRPKDELGQKTTPQRFDILKLNEKLESAIAAMGVEGIRVRDYLFLNGSDVRKDDLILPCQCRLRRPVQRVGAHTVQRHIAAQDLSIRHYKWIQIYDWNNQMVLSYFLRCSLKGNNLYVEAARFLLTPLDERYRKINTLCLSNWRSNLLWALRTALVAPFSAFFAWPRLFIRTVTAIRRKLGMDDRTRQREIKTNPLYNYGAAYSLRQKMSSTQFEHYFQKMDKEMYEKTFQQQILDAIVDFLDTHNVDTSELRQRQSTILNNGIIVQGGDVNAQSLAVGAEAKAGVIRRFMTKTKLPVASQQRG